MVGTKPCWEISFTKLRPGFLITCLLKGRKCLSRQWNWAYINHGPGTANIISSHLIYTWSMIRYTVLGGILLVVLFVSLFNWGVFRAKVTSEPLQTAWVWQNVWFVKHKNPRSDQIIYSYLLLHMDNCLPEKTEAGGFSCLQNRWWSLL